MTASRACWSIAALLWLGLASQGWSQSQEPTQQSVWSFAEHEPLVALSGETLHRGELEGRYVLLDFWATWCAPCLTELPNLKQLRATYPAERFLLISVSVEQTERRKLNSFLQRHDMTWPQLFDNRGLKGDLARRFGVEAVPRTVLIDPHGRIIAVDLRGDELALAVKAVLGTGD